MGTSIVLINPLETLSPFFHKHLYQISRGHTIHLIRSYIIVSLKFVILILLFYDHQIRDHWLQHMLIGPGRKGISYNNIFLLLCRPDAVRYNSVIGKIAATDDITCPCGRHCHPVVGKKRIFVTVSHQLGAGFTVRIGIVPIQRFVFPVSPLPLSVLINLIGGDIQKALYAFILSHAFTDIYGSHHIRLIGIDWFLIGIPNDGLRGEMDHDLWCSFTKYFGELVQISDICDHRVHLILYSCHSKEIRSCGRFQRISCHLCPSSDQGAAHPRPLESGMTCNQNFLSFKKR